MSKHAGPALAVLAALALGYVLGTGRSTAPEGRAFAGPTLIQGNAFTEGSGTWMTANADGDVLTLWRMHQGRVLTASRHFFYEGKTVNADFTTPAPGK